MRSVVPRRSMIAGIPAIPIATSVVPWRNGRPNESVITTPIVLPVSSSTRSRILRALASGSTGRRTSIPGPGALEWSTPAEAQMNPCCVWVITSGPLTRITFARGDAHRVLRGFDPVEVDDAALRLRDTLLGQHQHVVVVQLCELH